MIAIDSEFQSLIPPLSDDEYEGLEKSLAENGYQDWREPIITWNGTIIDGHNRYNICEEHGIKFRTMEMKFESRDAAKIWIIKNQAEERRNLKPYDRSALVLKLEPLYAAEAKRRQATSTGGAHPQLSQKSDEAVTSARTDEQLAKLAGVSRDTIRKVKVIEQEAANGNQTAIDARESVKSGKKSINRAYLEVHQNGDDADSRPLCTVCGKPIDDGDSYEHDQLKHKACSYKLERERKYRNPTIGDTSEVLTHDKAELRDSLLLVVQDMGDTLQSTINRYVTMGVKLNKSEQERIIKSLNTLTNAVNGIKE